MNVFRIAQISDLHFGASGQNQTWTELSRHLREDVHPDLLLVTGDIVDTPSRDCCAAAKDALEQLCQGIQGKDKPVNYYLCPGNHDRFPKGSVIGPAQGRSCWLCSPHVTRSMRDCPAVLH